jgi:glycine cleavage system H protein
MLRLAAPRLNFVSSRFLAFSQARSFAIIHKFSETHEWIKYDTDSNLATIGITKFAIEQMGDVCYVGLPEVGQEMEKGDSVIELDSAKTAVEAYALAKG